MWKTDGCLVWIPSFFDREKDAQACKESLIEQLTDLAGYSNEELDLVSGLAMRGYDMQVFPVGSHNYVDWENVVKWKSYKGLDMRAFAGRGWSPLVYAMVAVAMSDGIDVTSLKEYRGEDLTDPVSVYLYLASLEAGVDLPTSMYKGVTAKIASLTMRCFAQHMDPVVLAGDVDAVDEQAFEKNYREHFRNNGNSYTVVEDWDASQTTEELIGRLTRRYLQFEVAEIYEKNHVKWYKGLRLGKQTEEGREEPCHFCHMFG